jgi:putative ABC transport system permease protein
VRLPLLVTLAAASLILLVACINVAALLLARAVKRQGEMAVRLSLGAGVGRLLQQLVAESIWLSGAGGVAGLVVAWIIVRMVAAAPNLPLPRADGLHLNTPAVIATGVFAMIVTILFGWIPLLAHRRMNLSVALRPQGTAAGGRRRSSFSALVVSEIACAFVLTICVGLLVHSFWRVMHVDPGFQPRSLTRVYLRNDSPPSDGADALRAYTDEGRAFWEGVLREASLLPGVRAAALSDWRPGRDAAIATLVFDDRPNDPAHLPAVEGSWISPDFFRTVGTALVAGRSFTQHDNADGPPVVIIDAEAARRFWPNQNPIGRRIGINYTGPGRTSESAPRLREIVGVVNSMKHGALDAPAAPTVYMPYLQDESSRTMSAMSLLVRSEGDRTALAGNLRARIHAIRPNEPVQNIQSVDEMVAESVASRRFNVLILLGFGVVALVLVATGMFGVISYAISQRTREFGVRMALGATRGRVIKHVLREGGVLTALGMLVGTGAALFVTRSLSNLLFEIRPLDLISFFAAMILLAAISICACLVPAWRASRIDPIIAIRAE